MALIEFVKSIEINRQLIKSKVTVQTCKTRSKQFNKDMKQELLTRSNAEPPPKYSIMIHNLVSWKSEDGERQQLLWCCFLKVVTTARCISEHVRMTLIKAWWVFEVM